MKRSQPAEMVLNESMKESTSLTQHRAARRTASRTSEQNSAGIKVTSCIEAALVELWSSSL